MSPVTQALRPPVRLTPEQCRTARKLRRRGHDLADISARIAASDAEVRQALATMRTINQAPTRRSLNVTLAAHQFVSDEGEASEPCWETVDRLFGELVIRRALTGAAVKRRDQT